jgi:hypothetical protein
VKPLRIRALALLAIVFVFAAACGGDEEQKGGGGKQTLTKAEFLKQGNEICKEGTGDFNKLFETDFPATQGKAPAFFEKASPILRKQMSELRDLGAPEGDEDEVEQILDAGDKAVADFDSAAKDEQKAVQLFGAEGGESTADFEQRATRYGLTECAEDEEEEEGEVQKPDPSTFSPEKRAYVERADAICKRADERSDPIEDEAFRAFPPPLEVWASVIPRLLEIERPALQELRRLEPPAADRARVEGTWEKRADLYDTIEQARQAAAAKDENRFSELFVQVDQGFQATDRELKSYGFQVCGSEDDEGPGESPSPGATPTA